MLIQPVLLFFINLGKVLATVSLSVSVALFPNLLSGTLAPGTIKTFHVVLQFLDALFYFLVLFFSSHFGLDHFFFISKFTTVFLSSAISSVLISQLKKFYDTTFFISSIFIWLFVYR